MPRIEAEGGSIVAIRALDPVTQLGGGEREALDVGRVQEPPLGDAPRDLSELLSDAAHFADRDLTVRRTRFIALVADGTRRCASAANARRRRLDGVRRLRDGHRRVAVCVRRQNSPSDEPAALRWWAQLWSHRVP